MHVLLIADGRSPHTVGWVNGMAQLGIRTTLLSSHVLNEQQLGLLTVVLGPDAVHQPTDAWSWLRPRLVFASPYRRPAMGQAAHIDINSHTPTRRVLRLLAEVELHTAARLTSQLDRLIRIVRPDALHALRLQFEGIAATGTRTALPVAVSTWGSDLIHTGRTSDRLARRTACALRRADLLMSDCQRDSDLAPSWGLRPAAPRYVIPGNFGIDLADFPTPDPDLRAQLRLENRPLVVYPRGIRAVVNHRGFVHAAHTLLAENVDACFVGVGLSPLYGRQADVPGRLLCTDNLDHRTMLRLAACSAVTVSPSHSDGMPISVIEGMAGGAIPACGDLASLRELERQDAVIAWCDPGEATSIASAVKDALRLAVDPSNRQRNRQVVADRCTTKVAVERAGEAYQQLDSMSPRGPESGLSDAVPAGDPLRVTQG